MKKLSILMGILVLAHTSAIAYMHEHEASSLKTLERQGYSDSTMEIVDYIKYRSDYSGKYVRHYQQKPGKNIFGRAYQNFKVYFDPIQDDGRFGNHDIEYSNTWMGNDAYYSSGLKKNKQMEDL